MPVAFVRALESAAAVRAAAAVVGDVFLRARLFVARVVGAVVAGGVVAHT